MGKPKLRPLPAILKLVESLSEDERADLRDYLRPAPKPRSKSKPVSKPSQKRKVEKEATPITAECSKCPNPFGANVHHLTTEPDYHEFSEKTEFTASASG